MRWPRRLAIVMSLLTGALIVAGMVVVARSPTTDDVAYFAGVVGVGAVATVVGLVVARRRPGNVVGPLLTWIGHLMVFLVTREVYWRVLDRQPRALPVVSDWVVAALRESGVWLLVAVGLLLLFFPDGRLPGRRWRWVPVALVVDAVAFQASAALDPTVYRPQSPEPVPVPFGTLPEGVLLVFGLITLLGLMALTVVCAASLVVKYRRADEVRRAQLKWLALAGLGLPATLIGCGVELVLVGRPAWFSLAALIAVLVGTPVATAIAMLRHDLYDVDRALAGAVTYGAVTAVLLGVYTAMSFAAGIVLGPESTVAAAGATAACALALAPLRMRLQRRVDRRLYPLRQAALSAIDGLRERTHAGEAQPEELEEVLRSALRDPALRVGYLVPGVGGAIDAAGARTNPVGSVVPVTQGGVQIGLLLPGVGAASRELLRQVAAASAMLVEVVRLRLQLSGALREVEASRARLVQVGDHERRRLERDLHDGAQQRLVSLGMALRLAQRHIHDGAVDVDGLLDQSVAELGTAVAELRQIAHGLRPSTLDGGLGAALIALTQSVPMTVDLDVPDDQLPDAVATTAYYVASEALTNAVKHAEARRLDVRVVRSNGVVRVRISDDGRGGTTLRAGSGLAGLNDRVAALGGSLTVASPAGRGTVVEAVLPCGS